MLEIPAKIPHDVTKHARELSIKTFKVLSCEGLGRIDMFLRKDNQILVNEINTIPGFTKAFNFTNGHFHKGGLLIIKGRGVSKRLIVK